MGIEAAIIGSAVIGAGASAIGGSKAAKAQTQAAAQSAAVEREGIALQDRQFQQSRADLAPWREQGVQSLGQLAQMLQPNWANDNLASDPEHQFRMSQGLKAITANAASRGALESGATLKELMKFGQGVASDTFSNRWNRLSSLAGTGQTATNNTASLGANMAGNVQQGLSGIAQAYQSAGNARASSYANTAQAIGNAANTVGGYYTQNSMLKQLMAGGR